MYPRTVTHLGLLELAGVSVACGVCDTQERVFLRTAYQPTLIGQARPVAKPIRLFVTEVLPAVLGPLDEPGPMASLANGQQVRWLAATVLLDRIADVVDRGIAGTLSEHEQHLLTPCSAFGRLLVNSGCGLIPLIDEAADYEYNRKPDSLQRQAQASKLGETLQQLTGLIESAAAVKH